MAKHDNQKHPFIYDRATGEKIPVSKEIRDAYYREAARIRMKAQAHGQCVCPQSEVWACDGDCLVCEHRRSGDMASLDIPIGEDGEDTLLDMVPDETPSIESVVADRDLLDRLFAVSVSLTRRPTPSSPCGVTTTRSLTAPSPKPSVGPSVPSPTR